MSPPCHGDPGEISAGHRQPPKCGPWPDAKTDLCPQHEKQSPSLQMNFRSHCFFASTDPHNHTHNLHINPASSPS